MKFALALLLVAAAVAYALRKLTYSYILSSLSSDTVKVGQPSQEKSWL